VRASVRFVLVLSLAAIGSAPAWMKLTGAAVAKAKHSLGAPMPKITAIAPKMISNATSYPIMIYGEGFTPNLLLEIAARSAITVETSFIDARHLTARVPPITDVDPDVSTVQLQATLLLDGGARSASSPGLLLVNDRAFPTPYALEVSGGGQIYVASPTSAEIRIGTEVPDQENEAAESAGAVPLKPVWASVRTGDRPRALAIYEDGEGVEWLAVGCEVGEIDLFRTPVNANAAPAKRFTIPYDVQSIALDPDRRRIYATSHRADAIVAIDLDRGAVLETFATGLNPRPFALGDSGRYAIAGNLESEDVSVVDLEAKTERRLHPVPGTPIIGGHTARFVKDIMGGKAARDIVYSEKLQAAFMSTLGPNIGPNAERMEVSMNGGVSVIDPKTGAYLRHVSILYGASEGLALDDERGLLYVADGSTGRVVVMDAKRLVRSDKTAAKAILSVFDLPPPKDTPRIRPEHDFGVNGRAGASLHFGPKALRLSKDKRSLFVLSRFSGEVLELDTTRAKTGLVDLILWPPWVGSTQLARRTGEIVYFTDLGNTRMSCDTCHPEGHVGGLLFSKGTPIRVYRAHSMRGARYSPPYFTPSKLPSIKEMARRVLSRNRFQNPPTSDDEANNLTEYVGAVVQPPNPFVGKLGELPSDLVLPDGAHGNPLRGLSLFEGKAGCTAESCHPPPHFTADQDPATRGRLMSVGTPMVVPLRTDLQDTSTDFGQPPPTLLSIWDMFPLFLSGAGGNEVEADGTVVAKERFVLRWMIEEAARSKQHGNAHELTVEEKNDLLAYLLTL
jgi:hypothetical protein